uniref:Uncharacterized protein n=1 Tax=Nelumbo nucifera TaxID=4432 RepID=A0A822YI64_NELNU|nr:TPA_asm: hypothetical protein HUJ06_011013 [Nelumbo nucifera]
MHSSHRPYTGNDSKQPQCATLKCSPPCTVHTRWDTGTVGLMKRHDTTKLDASCNEISTLFRSARAAQHRCTQDIFKVLIIPIYTSSQVGVADKWGSVLMNVHPNEATGYAANNTRDDKTLRGGHQITVAFHYSMDHGPWIINPSHPISDQCTIKLEEIYVV